MEDELAKDIFGKSYEECSECEKALIEELMKRKKELLEKSG